MESQDSPTVIPCSEELSSKAEEDSESVMMVPCSDPASIQQTSQDASQSQSQSLLADLYDKSNDQSEEISSINVSEIKRTKFASINSSSAGVGRNSVSNSIVDMESSEINPMSSTRIEQDNSMSLLDEGFMIDSASLSLSAVNEDSHLNTEKTTTESNEIEEVESTEVEIEPEESSKVMEVEDESEEALQGSKSSKKRIESVESDEEQDENSADYPTPQFPLAKVKRIMAICAAADDQEDTDTNTKSKKGKGNMLITKEAIYLTSLATEHFVSVIGKMAANVTVSSKKKTLTLEHLKRAVSDSDAFAFLEGCFQPSLIIGD